MNLIDTQALAPHPPDPAGSAAVAMSGPPQGGMHNIPLLLLVLVIAGVGFALVRRRGRGSAQHDEEWRTRADPDAPPNPPVPAPSPSPASTPASTPAT